jgi:LysR family hydrogen peroxide-inducible transcriptional activator
MTLQQLRYIVTLDEYRHFGRAAEACGLTQPTLSLMIRKLEEELDVRIFDRQVHPPVPTEIGRQIIDQARIVLYNAAQIPELIRKRKDILEGSLRIGLISTVAPVLVPALFRYFGRNHPAVSLQTEEMITGTIKDKLHRAEVDIGILTAPAGDPNLLEIPLYSERFYAYISENDPAYALESIPSNSLRTRPIWIMKDGLRLFDPSEIQPGERLIYENYFEGGRVGTLIQIVSDNGGMTIIPETQIGLILFSLQKNLRPIVDPERKRTIALAVRKDFIREGLLNAVVRAIKSVIPGALLESMVRGDHIRL